MTDKQLIKQEIERRINISLEQGYTYSAAQLKRVIDFIDSLLEEHNKNLEEEISNYIKDNFFRSGSIGFLSNRTKGELDSIDVVNIARHFVEWQKQKDQETIELAEDHAMLAGMNKMREEMMKDAVDRKYLEDWYISSIDETKPPIWTDAHIDEVLKDFYLIPKEALQ